MSDLHERELQGKAPPMSAHRMDTTSTYELKGFQE